MHARVAAVDEEIRGYYQAGAELDRLEQGYSRIELERTKELLARQLPPAPARVLDVGGGPGVYAAWLADAGYDCGLVGKLHLAGAAWQVPLRLFEERLRAGQRPSHRAASLAW